MTPPPPITVPNFLTGEAIRLLPATDDFPVSDPAVHQIVAICNQAPVYRMLFAKRLEGRPYAEEDARRFLSWAHRGWREGTHFVFLLVTDGGEVVGAADVKSADRDSAEIGYWLSEHASGVMTNALRELVRLARAAGYRELFARVRVDNLPSAGVLTRSGFAVTDHFVTEGVAYDRFAVSGQATERVAG